MRGRCKVRRGTAEVKGQPGEDKYVGVRAQDWREGRAGQCKEARGRRGVSQGVAQGRESVGLQLLLSPGVVGAGLSS
jgi:hypothetical protein